MLRRYGPTSKCWPSKPFLPLKLIAGFIYDIDTGRVEEVVRWERPT